MAFFAALRRGLRATAPIPRAVAAARMLSCQVGHDWIGTESLLLALIQDDSTIPAKVLRTHNIDFALAQRGVLQVISGEEPLP